MWRQGRGGKQGERQAQTPLQPQPHCGVSKALFHFLLAPAPVALSGHQPRCTDDQIRTWHPHVCPKPQGFMCVPVTAPLSAAPASVSHPPPATDPPAAPPQGPSEPLPPGCPRPACNSLPLYPSCTLQPAEHAQLHHSPLTAQHWFPTALKVQTPARLTEPHLPPFPHHCSPTPPATCTDTQARL